MPPLGLNAFGPEVTDLQKQLRILGASLPETEARDGVFGQGTRVSIAALQQRLGLDASGAADEATIQAIGAAARAREAKVGRVQGRVIREDGAVGRDVEVALFRRLPGEEMKEVARGKSDEDGFYAVPLAEHLQDKADFEIRIVKGTEAVPAAVIAPDPAGFASVNLVVAAPKATEGEFGAVTTSLQAALGPGRKLTDIKEEGDRRDLADLGESTGWDPRLVAVAANAARLSETAKLPEAAAYALLRVGLPSDPMSLAAAGSDAVRLALGKASKDGIASFDQAATDKAVGDYVGFARETVATQVAPGQVAPPRRFAEDLALTASARDSLEKLAFVDQLRGDKLWDAAGQAGLDKPTIDALKLQGKLAALTQNNADLVKVIQADLGGEDVSRLAGLDLHRPAEWRRRIEGIAAGDAARLKAMVPGLGDADDVGAALDDYAGRMARTVRLSFPTAVAARMVESAELDLGPRHTAVKAQVVDVLRKAAAKRFDIDREPVGRFMRENDAELFGGLGDAQKGATQEALKSLQRIRQVTPDEETAKLLLKDGFSSAADIARVRWDDLVARYEPSIGRDRLELIARKARQVSLVTYSVFNAVRSSAAEPMFHATAPQGGEADRGSLVGAYPTLERLFGSQDFADCQDCRSVTSPAAYLVDILRFIDPEDRAWKGFLAAWQARRGEKYEDKYLAPYDALMERRPDVAHLPLTCENAETALPSIDLACRVLEWAVAKGKVEPEAFFDVGQARSEDLVAEPHRINPEAYVKLAEARYPAVLPFDLPLETARAFFAQAGVPLADALETMRTSDAFDPAGAYGVRAIAAERVGVGPLEAKLLTDQPSLDAWHVLYGFGTEAEALKALASARELSRRLAVSYEELAALAGTWFVNPAIEAFGPLPRIGVAPATLAAYLKLPGNAALSQEQSDTVESRLKAFSGEHAARGGDAVGWATSAQTQARLGGFLALTGPASSDFAKTSLAFLDSKGADGFVYARLALFVRLWRRLGWSMEDTDRALRVLIPAKLRPSTGPLGVPAVEQATLGAAMHAAILHLSHLRETAESLRLGRGERAGAVLALWADIDTRGQNSVYARMFVRPGDQNADPAFDHPLGDYLAHTPAGSAVPLPFTWDPSKAESVTDGNVSLRAHLAPVLAALRLSAAEVEAILTDARGRPPSGSATDVAPLDLATVSLLHRHALLARGLRLPVGALLSLKGITGLDPFAALPDDAPSTAEQDTLLSQTLRFVRAALMLRDAGVEPEALDWLLRHRLDPVGPRRPDPRSGVDLMRGLGVAIARIRADHDMPADPFAFSDERIAAELSAAVPAPAADAFLAAWTDRALTQVDVPGVPEGQKLDPALFKDETAVTGVAYLAGSGTQRLTYRGFAGAADIARLKGLSPGDATLEKVVDALAVRLAGGFTTQFGAFLQAADAETLLAPLAAGADEAAAADRERRRRRLLADRLIPFLQGRLARTQVVEAMTAATAADRGLVEALVTDQRLLADGTMPLAATLEQAAERGLDAVFSASGDGSAPEAPVRLATADTSVSGPDGKPIRPAGARSVRLEGWVEVVEAGAYSFEIRATKAGTRVVLSLGEGDDPLLRATADADGWSLRAGPVDLKPGRPVPFSLEAFETSGGDVSVLVTGDTLPASGLDALLLYPAGVARRLQRARARLEKALATARLLDVSEAELAHLAAHPEDFAGFSLGSLPLDEEAGNAAAAPALFRGILALLDYRRLRREVTGDGTGLLELLALARRRFPADTDEAAAARGAVADLCARLGTLARRGANEVAAAADLLGTSVTAAKADGALGVRVGLFAEPSSLVRLWDILRLASATRLPVAQLSAWTVPDPDMAAAAGLRDAVRAGYDAPSWRVAAKPLFDGLRQKRRDALVAYLMQRDGHEQPESLFEQYLMDPGMEPVVVTSPLQFAISGVQTFIQRCLLNLEPEVPPQAVDAERWAAIRRYPVWAGSRLLFLHPAQLLDPSLRDDKTHLFRDLEQTLLQGEVTDERAEAAFAQYLRGLEEIARLTVVSMWAETDARDQDRTELHVLARTQRVPHRHFYRTAADGIWRPWLPVDVEVEGDLACVLPWRGRTFVFWVTFVERDPPPDSGTIETAAKKTPGQLLQRSFTTRLNWAELMDGVWSGPFGVDAGRFTFGGPAFSAANYSIRPQKELDAQGRERAVLINLSDGSAIRLASIHAPPRTVRAVGGGGQPYDVEGGTSAGLLGSGDLTVTFRSAVPQGKGEPTRTTAAILGAGQGFRLVPSNPPLLADTEFGQLVAPFFYEDEENLLFVAPTLKVETVETWDSWVPPPFKFPDAWKKPKFWDDLPVVPQIPLPRPKSPIDPGDPAPWLGEGGKPWVVPKTGPVTPFPQGGSGGVFDPRVADPAPARDWLTMPSTVVPFGERVVSRGGALDLVRLASDTGPGRLVAVRPEVGGILDTFKGTEIVRDTGRVGGDVTVTQELDQRGSAVVFQQDSVRDATDLLREVTGSGGTTAERKGTGRIVGGGGIDARDIRRITDVTLPGARGGGFADVRGGLNGRLGGNR